MKSELRPGSALGSLWVRWSFGDSLLPIKPKSEAPPNLERRKSEGRAKGDEGRGDMEKDPAAKLRGTVALGGERWLQH